MRSRSLEKALMYCKWCRIWIGKSIIASFSIYYSEFCLIHHKIDKKVRYLTLASFGQPKNPFVFSFFLEKNGVFPQETVELSPIFCEAEKGVDGASTVCSGKVGLHRLLLLEVRELARKLSDFSSLEENVFWERCNEQIKALLSLINKAESNSE